MSYVTYTTDALVCGGSDRGTYDRSIMLFTKNAGLLFAIARGVRKEASRQRYALTVFSRVRVSLIKGKQGWIIGSVETYCNDFSEAKTRDARTSVVRIYRLIRRYVHGEEPVMALYETICTALDQLKQLSDNYELFDEVVAVRCLMELGYIASEDVPVEFRDGDFAFLAAPERHAQYPTLRRLVEQAAASSHL